MNNFQGAATSSNSAYSALPLLDTWIIYKSDD
jgi:hypothetical protein